MSMTPYILGIDIGTGPEYAGETILAFRDGGWVTVSIRVWGERNIHFYR